MPVVFGGQLELFPAAKSLLPAIPQSLFLPSVLLQTTYETALWQAPEREFLEPHTHTFGIVFLGRLVEGGLVICRGLIDFLLMDDKSMLA